MIIIVILIVPLRFDFNQRKCAYAVSKRHAIAMHIDFVFMFCFSISLSSFQQRFIFIIQLLTIANLFKWFIMYFPLNRLQWTKIDVFYIYNLKVKFWCGQWFLCCNYLIDILISMQSQIHVSDFLYCFCIWKHIFYSWNIA